MDYKKKYLKYKSKYLNTKKILGGAKESALQRCPPSFIITVATDAETRAISARPTDHVLDTIATAFGRQVEDIEEALLGDDAVQPGESFQQWGIEDGARLCVRFRAPKTFEEFVAETIKLNPSLTREGLMGGVEVDTEDASRVKGDVNWSNKDIKKLPPSIGDLTVDGYLDLTFNDLEELPESFGNLIVGKNLNLANNKLASLPESFGNLKVGEDLYLINNLLASIPETLGSNVKGAVRIGGNEVANRLKVNFFSGIWEEGKEGEDRLKGWRVRDVEGTTVPAW